MWGLRVGLSIFVVSWGLFGSTTLAQEKAFTVRDSIEMSVFTDPYTRVGGGDAEVTFSPDKTHFLVVTTKGLIETNEIESTLWVFDSALTRDALLSQSANRPFVPKVLARFAAVINESPVISHVTWSQDSKSILFLGQKSTNAHQLYEADIADGVVHALTPPGTDVTHYESARGETVYTAAIPDKGVQIALRGQPINASARAVTGLPFDAILFPNSWLEGDFLKSHELWQIRNGINKRVVSHSSSQPVKVIIDGGYGNILSLSPDGKSAVVLQQVDWEPSWQEYEPIEPYFKFHTDTSTSKFLTPWYDLPAAYVLVNLENGATTPLVNAPIARFQGYGQPTRVVWSEDGKKVLLGATYMPLSGVSIEERVRRKVPCAAAVVDVLPFKSTCAATMDRTHDPNARFVGNIAFGRSDREVILDVVNGDRQQLPPEKYLEANAVWKREISPPTFSEDAVKIQAKDQALSAFVHQDLNQAPALFVRINASGRPVKLWDPNPNLSSLRLGKASVLRWKDAAGHEWVAGLVKPLDYHLGRKYPLVIQTHGFVEHHFLTDGGYTSALAARPLASAGIVVLQMPYNPEHFVSAQELPDQILGFESAIDLLASEGMIDPSRVGIIGFSRTCYHVEGALIKDPTRFAAATIADGVDESYVQYLTNTVDSVHKSEQEAIYGTKPFGEGLKTWITSAPGFNLDKVKTPLRIEAISGTEAVLGEWEIYASLHLQGKPVDLISFPDGVHELVKPWERMASQQGNVDWFRFWLQGYEDPDPAKVEQYKRWRELRKLQQQYRPAKLKCDSGTRLIRLCASGLQEFPCSG